MNSSANISYQDWQNLDFRTMTQPTTIEHHYIDDGPEALATAWSTVSALAVENGNYGKTMLPGPTLRFLSRNDNFHVTVGPDELSGLETAAAQWSIRLHDGGPEHSELQLLQDAIGLENQVAVLPNIIPLNDLLANLVCQELGNQVM